MAITAKQVNELRKMTGAGLMDCKKALSESNGDMEAAVDFLRKKGQKVAELRAGRDANEGAVVAKTTQDGKRGVIVHLSCETDFVAKNADFVSFAQDLADLALKAGVTTKDEFLSVDMNGTTVGDRLAEKVGAIGENIQVANYEVLEAQRIVPYIHAGNRIGVLVGMNMNGDDSVDVLGKDIAMQVAAMRPVALDESSVSEEAKERELAIAKEKALADGKPEHIIDRIAEGALKKFYKENTLVHQQFVKDGSKTVAQVIKELNSDLEILGYKRVELGD